MTLINSPQLDMQIIGVHKRSEKLKSELASADEQLHDSLGAAMVLDFRLSRETQEILARVEKAVTASEAQPAQEKPFVPAKQHEQIKLLAPEKIRLTCHGGEDYDDRVCSTGRGGPKDDDDY